MSFEKLINFWSILSLSLTHSLILWIRILFKFSELFPMAKKIHMPLSNKNRRRRRVLAEIAIFKFSRIEDELCVMLKRVPWTRAIYYNIPLYLQIRSLWRADGSLGTSLWSFLTKLLVYYTHTAFNKKIYIYVGSMYQKASTLSCSRSLIFLLMTLIR